jgi:hypothetical protein
MERIRILLNHIKKQNQIYKAKLRFYIEFTKEMRLNKNDFASKEVYRKYMQYIREKKQKNKQVISFYRFSRKLLIQAKKLTSDKSISPIKSTKSPSKTFSSSDSFVFPTESIKEQPIQEDAVNCSKLTTDDI